MSRHMTRHQSASVAAILIALSLAGCTSWYVERVHPQAVIDREHPTAIQVREKKGAQYIMNTPALAGDSLTGTVNEARRGVPLTAIEWIAVRKPNGIGNVALFVFVIGGAAGLLVAQSIR